MGFILESLYKALQLIISLDTEFVQIVFLSLKVSLTAVVISTLIGLGISILLYQFRIPCKQIFIVILNTSMGLPPVVVGLFLYLLLSRSGPLGFLDILYTPIAMVVAQVLLATPIIAALGYSSLVSTDTGIRFTAIALGASHFQATVKVINEAKFSIMAGITAGLGRVIAEVGAVLIVGGNIAGYTRVMTTAIALEADRGDFILAIALGIILLAIALLINSLLFMFQKTGKR
jgi:tungstate transport system permease protein